MSTSTKTEQMTEIILDVIEWARHGLGWPEYIIRREKDHRSYQLLIQEGGPWVAPKDVAKLGVSYTEEKFEVGPCFPGDTAEVCNFHVYKIPRARLEWAIWEQVFLDGVEALPSKIYDMMSDKELEKMIYRLSKKGDLPEDYDWDALVCSRIILKAFLNDREII
tara:strand:- start:444 stop:935 length:492 start_codon:yes stop_codon:yes gene_type:complete